MGISGGHQDLSATCATEAQNIVHSSPVKNSATGHSACFQKLIVSAISVTNSQNIAIFCQNFLGVIYPPSPVTGPRLSLRSSFPDVSLDTRATANRLNGTRNHRS